MAQLSHTIFLPVTPVTIYAPASGLLLTSGQIKVFLELIQENSFLAG